MSTTDILITKFDSYLWPSDWSMAPKQLKAESALIVLEQASLDLFEIHHSYSSIASWAVSQQARLEIDAIRDYAKVLNETKKGLHMKCYIVYCPNAQMKGVISKYDYEYLKEQNEFETKFKQHLNK